ncbi:hypothetical protein [Micromonospora auratinigra]|nr:hypothetical protein [Micromonospora auratinigra]
MPPALQAALVGALTAAVVVPIALRRAAGRPRDLVAPDRPTGEAPVLRLVREQRRIEAVAVLRQQTGLPLKEAKQVVDLLAAVALPPPARDGAVGPLDDELRASAAALVRAGRKIQAVKVVREHTGWSLADAKRYVDSL